MANHFYTLILIFISFIVQSCYTQLASKSHHPRSNQASRLPQGDSLFNRDSSNVASNKETVVIKEYHWVDNYPTHRWYDWEYPYFRSSLRFSFYHDYYGCYWDDWHYAHPHHHRHYKYDGRYDNHYDYDYSHGGSSVSEKPSSLFPNQSNLNRAPKGKRRSYTIPHNATKIYRKSSSGSSSSSKTSSKNENNYNSASDKQDDDTNKRSLRPRKRGRR